MGKDSPAKLNCPQVSKLDESKLEDNIDNDKRKIQNNPPNKENDCQSIIDMCKDNNSCVRDKEKYHTNLLHEWKSCDVDDKEHFIQRNNQ